MSTFAVDAWKVSIEDQGPGVPEDQRERIFERFVRLDHDGSRDEKGSGLGLAISRSIISLHRGVIRADPGSQGRGLRVSFELPIGEISVTDSPFESVGARPARGASALQGI